LDTDRRIDCNAAFASGIYSAHYQYIADCFFAFAIMGIFMPRLKQNYMAGFRLPWTLEDEQNWEYTHSLAGKYWLYGGLLQGITAVLLQGKWIFITFMLILAVMIIAPLIHSFTFFKKHKKA
jgi:uncharacterized membrane protein